MVAEHNTGSIRVLEKVGFVREGGPDEPAVVGADGVGEFVYLLK
jgi:RimJ/RimL family protein N-acetyltransferase